ncbi:MAG: heavy-metal-associated domain-containing protein [Peptostreptococcaceae bacterium]|jgi:copper-exporting ATPase|nr:heavy-metal-associated domain-containing protein [Peptostreptococcaceae bacterium]
MFGLFEKKYDNTITLKIDGMMCGHCEAHVSDALRKVEGVEKVTASHTKKTAIVQSNKQLDKELLKKAVDDTGYTVVEII